MARACRIKVHVKGVTVLEDTRAGSLEDNVAAVKELVKNVTDAGWLVTDGDRTAQGGFRRWCNGKTLWWWKGPDTIERVK